MRPRAIAEARLVQHKSGLALKQGFSLREIVCCIAFVYHHEYAMDTQWLHDEYAMNTLRILSHQGELSYPDNLSDNDLPLVAFCAFSLENTRKFVRKILRLFLRVKNNTIVALSLDWSSYAGNTNPRI